ncbi:hypothetical protein [Aquimarina brevivitae]|uniref:Uncharacterized protein n=1 Tax=Aquimarina brevivitae TaxID=323412 RepID=A0A4Q7P3J2_9FLAO|nr:hypothetical protein [Aquimarina brevivitae]RZS93980.1 hypothetical protein EV197_2562 [Aquimarina brevivitae]
MKIEIIPLILSLFPALFVAVLAYLYFKMHTDNEERRRRYLLHKENQKQSLPLRLQAYERMALFLERISPGKLMQRMAPVSDDKKGYENLLIHTIDQEFEHNLTQQIYITDESWSAVRTAKNNTIALIRKAVMDESVDTAAKMRETIITKVVENGAPSDAALSIIKAEVTELMS